MAEKINRAFGKLFGTPSTPWSQTEADSPTLAAYVPPASTLPQTGKPRFHRIRMLQKLPRGNKTGGLVALSREQQLVKRPTGLTSMITNWLEGSGDQCRCKNRIIFEGVIFLQVILRHSAFLWQNYFKTSETILYIMLYFYVTIRACDSLYGVKLKAAIFICDIQAMLAFLLFQINAFGTVKEVVQS